MRGRIFTLFPPNRYFISELKIEQVRIFLGTRRILPRKDFPAKPRPPVGHASILQLYYSVSYEISDPLRDVLIWKRTRVGIPFPP